MMKRLITLWMAVLLMLCGCEIQHGSLHVPTEPPATLPPQATESTGTDAAGRLLESTTDGALQVYPLSRTGCTDIAHMGTDLLIFSGTDTTILTKYSGDKPYLYATTELDCSISPDDPAVQISEKGITYYDARENELVFLDAQLTEVKRVPLPETICGNPALSADRLSLYYCTADALRCIDLETGLDRLVKELYFMRQIPAALHCDDTIITCSAEDRDGNQSILYISTETGQLLWESFLDIQLWTDGSFYFALHRSGIYQELLIGDSEQGPTLLTPHTYNPTVHPLLNIHGVVTVSEVTGSDALQLDHYVLPGGKRTASLTLNGSESVLSICAADEQALWFLRYDSQYQSDVLCRWDLTQSATENEASRLSARYTTESPDYAGLVSCRETAQELSERYGVQILLWTDATAFQPWDYTLVPEYHVPVIRQELKSLEDFLSMYPEGFLEKAAARTTSGRIQICLVRSILGNNTAEGALSEAVGLQYWDDNTNAYLCLAVGQSQLPQTACHEMFHIIESRVMTLCKAYDDWNALNPKGFQYDNDYVANLYREDSQWTDGESRAFIDTYSMSYPKEDRARIMEYAMHPGNQRFFESETMQNKLRQLCLGIREAFDLKNSTTSYLWEQYLKEPLAKP